MKTDFEVRSSTVSTFWHWINERHHVYLRKERGVEKPWTADKVLQEWKFTNVFRQLDRGTIALKNMLKRLPDDASPELIAWTIIWYRLFNLDEHADDLAPGYMEHPDGLGAFLKTKQSNGKKIFTGAHMTTGVAGEDKLTTYSTAVRIAYAKANEIVDVCAQTNSLERVFKFLKDNLYMVGPFVAYEIVCDFRFTMLLDCAGDILTWANVGPGAKRGMKRLGFEPSVETMCKLYDAALDQLGKHLVPHLPSRFTDESADYPPFELREIEHSLCEFDKYERVRLEQGRPRQRYPGWV